VRPLGLVAVLLALAVAAGCGEKPEPARSGSGGSQRLTVSAATSLKKVMTAYGEGFHGARVRLSFAGSDELAAQIRGGARPDVFAAANVKLPAALFKEALVGRPTVFAANRLVLAVPAGSKKVSGLDDVSKSGVKLAIGAAAVPVGSYTRDVLARLGKRESKAILANVRSNEPDVGGVVGKLTQGAVDAGFVYATDVTGAGGKLEAIELPQRLQPSVAYAVAIVKGAKNPGAARRFVAGLLNGPGAQALKDAGFQPPPPT
jgi:molybdate transport system substrate-binding protein